MMAEKYFGIAATKKVDFGRRRTLYATTYDNADKEAHLINARNRRRRTTKTI